MPKKKIRTIRDLYDSMPDNVAYACLGKYYFKWSRQSVPEDEQHLCRGIEEVLGELGYELVDPNQAGTYNDIKGYMGCRIKELD